MKNKTFIILIIAIWLTLFTTSSYAAISLDAFIKYDLNPNSKHYDSSFKNPTGRGFNTHHTIDLSPGEYKTHKGFNRNSYFYPSTSGNAKGYLSRTLHLGKKTLGGLGRFAALSGTPMGLALQAALLAAGYYLNDDETDIVEREYLPETGPYYHQTGSYGSESGATAAVEEKEENPGLDCYHTTFNDGVTYQIYCANKQPVTEDTPFEETPVIDEDIHDSVIEDMTDSEFNTFINDSSVVNNITNTTEANNLVNDITNDYSTSTDITNNGNPDTSTQPTTVDQYDTDLDTLSVPEFDNKTLSGTPVDNTNPIENSPGTLSVDSEIDVQTTTSTTTNPDGSTTTDTVTTTTTTNPDGTTTTDTNTNTTTSSDPTEENYSLSYSTSKFPNIPDFYSPKYENGLQGIWDEKQSGENPMLEFLNGLISGVPTGGACPSFVVDFNLGMVSFGSHDMAPPCYIWDYIRIIILVGVTFAVRQIIFGG